MITTEYYDLPAYWASALINGDNSGLSDQDEKDMNNWLTNVNPGYCIDVSEDSYIGTFKGMLCDMCTYTFAT